MISHPFIIPIRNNIPRKIILKIMEEEKSRDIVVQKAVSYNYKIEDVEKVLEELIANGLVLSPRYGILKRA